MSGQHTPGPWDPNDGFIIAGHADACVAECYGSEEDLHLIAAAPDLLAALKRLLGQDEQTTGEWLIDMIEQGEAAIRLAETGERS